MPFFRMRYILPAMVSLFLVSTLYWQKQWNAVGAAIPRGGMEDIRNKTLGFGKVFVVALPDRLDHQDLWSLASTASDIEFEYVEGTKGEAMNPKAIPIGWDMKLMETEPGTLGCYRGHLNAMRKIVEERIETALIFEDDADWDVSIKAQLVEFAKGAKYVQSGGSPSEESRSPYGDDWDLLWLGHCGVKNDVKQDGYYYAIENDPTVLAFEKRSHELQVRKPDTSPPQLGGNYTRMVFESGYGLCAYGYAMTLRGARKFLYQYSVKPQAPIFDKAMSAFCGKHQSGAKCIATYPGLVDQYKQPGNEARNSDRRKGENLKDSFRDKGETWNVAFPMKVGLGSFVEEQVRYKSQYPGFTLLNDMDPVHHRMPTGRGFFIKKDEFKEGAV